MKYASILFFAAVSILFADRLDVLKDYEAKQFAKACIDGNGILKDYRGDETFINTVAFSCLEADIIDLLPNPIVMLKETPTARQNASYYATILFQKKMLYHALVDGVDISSVRAPQVDYILSHIFDLFVRGAYEKKGSVYHLKYEGADYEMQIVHSARYPKIEIKKIQAGKLIQTHYYW